MTESAVRQAWVEAVRETTGDFNYGRSCMPSLDGGRSRYGRTYRAVWPRVVSLCQDHGVTPDRLFSHILRESGTTRGGTPPQLTAFLTPAVLQAVPSDEAVVQSAVVRVCTAIRQLHSAVVDRISAGWGEQPAAQHVCCDACQRAALAAYVVARSFGCHDAVLNALWPDAYAEFTRLPTGVSRVEAMATLFREFFVAKESYCDAH